MAKASNEGNEKAKAIEGQLIAMLDDHKHRLLELGAPGRLLITGELEDVLLLEDADALEEAKSMTPGGKMKSALQKIEARHDAQICETMKESEGALFHFSLLDSSPSSALR
jgi:hypothetical protein